MSTSHSPGLQPTPAPGAGSSPGGAQASDTSLAMWQAHEISGLSLAGLIGRFVRRHARAYALAGGMLLTIALLTVWLPRQVGFLVDGLVKQQLHGGALWCEVAWLMAAGVAIYLLRVGWRLQLYAAAYRMGVALRECLYDRLAAQGPRFFQTRRTGDLMALATNDVDAVEMAAGEAVLAGFDGTLTLCLVLIAMAAGVDWRLAAAALLPFPFMALAFWRISTRLHDASREALERFGALNDHVQESLSGVRTLRALGLEAQESQRFHTLAEQAADAGWLAQRWESWYEPAVGITLSLASALALGLGAWLVWQDELSVGQLTSFGMYLGQLIWPMFATGWVLSLWERGRAAWIRLAAVLAEPLAIDNKGQTEPVQPGELRLEDLSFAYPNSQHEALCQLNLRVQPGMTLGLVGPTGAGKSTLLRLLLRQWTPQQGQLRWAGVNLSDYRPQALRAAMAWVPQEPVLFSASVAENIALGKPGASAEEIENVARLAAVHEDILRLPMGYQTPVGERGVTLSGGQKQRVAIARALLADAPLLLLDDALSAVDSHTEHAILSHLREQRRGRTVIIVSHRLSAVADADQIAVLLEGRLVALGRHDELLAPGPEVSWYAQQWRIQQLTASLEGEDSPAAEAPATSFSTQAA